MGVTAIQGSEEHSIHIVWAISFALTAHGSFPAELAFSGSVGLGSRDKGAETWPLYNSLE